MSGQEFTDWMAYERLEPFGPLAEEFRAGQICAVIANRGRTKDFVKASDFMPALRRLLEGPTSTAPKTDNLTPDQHANLMDASLFGIAKAKP